jgi:DNA-binding transcriptional ArsR family regulator
MKQFTEFFKALSDPTRRDILQSLKKKSKTPSELLEEIKVSQPTLSHHLDILKRADIISGERDGQFIRYSLNMTVFDMAVEYLIEITKSR